MELSTATKRQVASLGCLAAVAVLAALVFSPSAVLTWVAHLNDHPVAFLSVLLVLYLVRPVLMWPLSVLSLTVGFVFGAEVGVPVALAGMVVSNTVVFYVARYARTDAGMLGSVSRSGDRLVETTGELRGMIAARLAPLPADVVSSAAGLSDVSYRTYLAGMLLGESPWIAAEVIAGSSMHTLSVHGLSHSLSLVVGASALAAVLLARPVYEHFRGPDPTVGGR